MPSYTWNYSFTLLGLTDTITVTTTTTASNGTYAITGISGTIGGNTISGIDTTYGSPSNVLGNGPGFVDGVNASGFSFDTSSLLGLAEQIRIANIGGTPEIVASVSTSGLGVPLVGLNFSTNAPACFRAGTRVRALRDGAAADVAVEELRVGDIVLTARGDRRPVIWLGHRTIDCTAHPQPQDVHPIRIAAGAFAPGMPHADLWLSPDHAIFVDGVLIPARYLVNDATIVQENVDIVQYWHVELDRHDVLLAEGLPTESYLDSGNRSAFANTSPTWLHASFGVRDRAAWARKACGPLIESGLLLDALRARLAEIAVRLACPIPAAERVELAMAGETAALLPPGCERVILASECQVPAGERRRLGAYITGIRIDGVAVPLDGAACVGGFHAVEALGDGLARWTNGEGILSLPPATHTRVLSVEVALLAAPALSAAA